MGTAKRHLTYEQNVLATLLKERRYCRSRSLLGPLDKAISEQRDIVAAEMAANLDLTATSTGADPA